MNGDTIAAISTSAGKAAIGIIKMSGPKAVSIADKIFLPSSKKKLSSLKTFNLIHGRVINDQNEPVDETLVSFMKGPKSYTGEDVVEINCHGGIVATREVLALVLGSGARIAEPGEFTKRAFLNGRIDLIQAESVANIVEAKTSAALRIAQSQLDGRLSDIVNLIRSKLIDISVQLQAAIDFSDEDIEPDDYKSMLSAMKSVKKKTNELLETNKSGHLLKEGIKTAIIGAPNVGKSSLLNALLKKERAIVTPAAGTTRDLIEEIVDVEGLPLVLQDTAGIREAFDEAESKGIELSKKALSHADLVLLVIDSSKQLSEADELLLRQAKKENTLALLNKSDLETVIEAERIKKIYDFTFLKISALRQSGIDRLKKKIYDTCIERSIDSVDALVSSERQAQALRNGLECIDRAQALLKNHESEELIAFETKNAINALNEIVGEISNDDVLDKLFSSFCIGK